MLKKDNHRSDHDRQYGDAWGSTNGHYEIDMQGVITLADAIKDMGALSVLNLANNQLGGLVLPEGWSEKYTALPEHGYKHTDGREQDLHPGKPEGVIAVANAIRDMRAMTSLNLASNSLRVEGAKIVAAFLPKCT
jgi:hypothetical protein